MSNAARKPKRPKNLLLDPDAVARGERYSRRHGISLSRLVGDFLRSLPLDAERSTLTPAVRRLWESLVAMSNDATRTVSISTGSTGAGNECRDAFASALRLVDR
jgi:hypothetical protein